VNDFCELVAREHAGDGNPRQEELSPNEGFMLGLQGDLGDLGVPENGRPVPDSPPRNPWDGNGKYDETGGRIGLVPKKAHFFDSPEGLEMQSMNGSEWH